MFLPPLDGGDELVELAHDAGWCGYGANGPVPMAAAELAAWCNGTGERLSQWEFAMVLNMSRAYVAGVHAARAPWQPTAIRMALATAGFDG